MDWSLGETRALAVKAARGAGMPWGLAEEAGFSVHWLQQQGAPGVAALALYLQWREANQVLFESGNTLCPFVLGSTLIDSEVIPSATALQIVQPLLSAPFLAIIADKIPHQLNYVNARVLVSNHGLFHSGTGQSLLTDVVSCTITKEPGSKVELNVLLTRVDSTAAEHLRTLEKYASRTYAPATEQSRLSGAGAGTTDND